MSAGTELSPGLLAEFTERFSNWGRWGDGDQIGTANLITPGIVAGAARAVERGQVVGLGLPFSVDGPQTGANGRFNCMRFSVASGSDHVHGTQRWAGTAPPNEMGYADDTVVLHLQSATHWDSLAHIFHRGRMYNGYDAAEYGSAGAVHNGTEQLADRLVGRGVLLDVPRSKGVEWLEDGYAITVEDLEAAAEHGRVEVAPGDILLLRTGQLARCRQEGWGTYAGGDAPGLSFATIPWLHGHDVAAVASDTWGVEVRPNELPGSFQPFHIPTVVYMGLLLGEMFDFERLAELSAEDGRHDALVCASPLAFVGTAGGPPGPVAIR